MKKFDLNALPSDFPKAMSAATLMGRIHEMRGVRQTTSVRAISEQIAPGCGYGYALPLKQAYNAGRWSAKHELSC